jgi:hypothetical protein
VICTVATARPHKERCIPHRHGRRNTERQADTSAPGPPRSRETPQNQARAATLWAWRNRVRVPRCATCC